MNSIETAAPARAVAFTNVRLQLPDRELLGTIAFEDGRIADITQRPSRAAVDLDGALCLPGLIELHTDHLETVLAPRPGVRWPLDSAVHFHDRLIAAAGITTVCDAIAVGETLPGARAGASRAIADAVARGLRDGRSSVDHRIHLRCEIGYGRLMTDVEALAQSPLLALVSVMDHTPGQRQFADLDKFAHYYAGKHGLDAAGVEALIAGRRRDQALHADRNRAAVAALARAKGVPLATHDDATAEHVAQAVADGATIAEFPTSLEAAHAAHEAGLLVLMGAPNVLLGGSQSGNVAALDLVRAGLVDIFSSDYVPQSLLAVPFATAAATGEPLYRALHRVTQAPAHALGLHDRGALAVGRRADVVFADAIPAGPLVRAVFVGGARVA